MSNENQKIYKAGKDSVKKALELFSNTKRNLKRTKVERDEDKPNKNSQYCTLIISNGKKKCVALTFLPSFSMTELRLCLMRHDWVNVQRLFPLLLELSNDKETLVWRYALTILLHSPMSSPAHLIEFLNSCVGCQNDNHNYVLDQLITLRKNDTKTILNNQ